MLIAMHFTEMCERVRDGGWTGSRSMHIIVLTAHSRTLLQPE